MTHAASARRGQPIVALLAIVLGWVMVRAAVWSPGVMQGAIDPPALAMAQARSAEKSAQATKAASAVTGVDRRSAANSAMLMAGSIPSIALQGLRQERPHRESLFLVRQLAAPSDLIRMNPAIAGPRLPPPKPPEASPATSEPAPSPLKDDPRWSSDRWLLMRRGSGAAAQAPGAASYGASQAGAVVRYRLGKGDHNAAYGYLRTSLAINAPGNDKEIALGLGARPIARIPLRVLVEARLQDTSRSPMRVRPVATVVTELPWQKLPFGFRAEAYGQAGYAGGRDSTAFFDAQGLVDHPLPNWLGTQRDLRAGAGFWAGGQKGAVRLDVGPRVSFAADLGEEVPSRIALDWRFRVAGNARPGSGPAITIASSF